MQHDIEIDEKEYNYISTLIHNLCGINLHDGKKELVRARLSKRLRILGLGSFKQYIKYVEDDATKEEFSNMVDALSTNLTSFFREEKHFEFLRDNVIPEWSNNKTNQTIKIWSAGCSSGEELYTIAIVLHEAENLLKKKQVKILATDISSRMLEVARKAGYKEDRITKIPKDIQRKYFLKGDNGFSGHYLVKQVLREMVTRSRLNLLGDWRMKGKFDLIFCRNVMIYFDKPTQETLVNRYWNVLNPGGYLFIGHSESLTGIKHRFKYSQPTIYRKE